MQEQTGPRFLEDFRGLDRKQRERAQRCMAEIRADPLTLRDGWRLLPFPFQPGTTVASLGDIDIRFTVKLDATGEPVALVWLRAIVRDEPLVR